MKSWKIICIVSLAVNVFVLSLWLTGHLRYEKYPGAGPVKVARLIHGEPMETLPAHSRAMAYRIIRAYDDFVSDRTGRNMPLEEAYARFFADALEGYYGEEWDFWRMVPGDAYFDRVARILFREPHDLLPVVRLDYVSPSILSSAYSVQDDDLMLYSGWSLSLENIRDNTFVRSLMANNRDWAHLVETACACGSFLPPGFLTTLRDHPEYFDFADDATRLYLALVFLDRYIQFNSDYRLVI